MMNETGLIRSFDGLQLYCQKQGNGPAVLLIHGACVDSDCFTPLAELLEKEYTVYRYDRAGYGRSEERNSDTDSLSANAADLCEVIRKIGPPLRAIAHSAGGVIAMKLAETDPDLFSELLIFESLIIRDLIRDEERRIQFDEIAELIHRTGNYYRAFDRFEQYFDYPHVCSDILTREESRRIVKNCRTFFLQDYCAFQEYLPQYDLLNPVPIYIGCSSLGKGTFRWEESALLAERVLRPLIEFSGGHNAPFKNPEAFLSKWKTIR